jgi:PAS domain S-box-containing protein
MGGKLTCQELKQKGRELEKETVQHKQIEATLRESEERHRRQHHFLANAINSLNYPFYVVDPHSYKIVYANSFMDLGDLSGHPTCYSIIHNREEPCKGDEHPCPLKEIKETKRPVTVEHIHYNQDGQKQIVEVHGSPIFDDQENVVQVVESCFDITMSKKLEVELEESQERYQRIIGAVTDYVYTVHIENGRSVRTVHNPLSVAVTGYSPEDFTADPFLWLMMVVEEDRAIVLEQVALVLQGQNVKEFEHRIVRKDGVVRWVSNTFVLNCDPHGKLLSYDGILKDITDRKQAEESLRESEEKFRLTFENARDAILWAEPNTGIIINCNKAAEILLEKDRKEIIGQHQTTLHPIEKRKYYSSMFKQHIEQKGFTDAEAEIITKTGKTIPVRIIASIISIGEKAVLQGIFHDITIFKIAEEALKKSSEKTKLFAYTVAHDLKNPAVAIFGLTKLLHKNCYDVLDEKGKNYCDQILKSSEQIAALAEKINTFISTKEKSLNIERVNPKEIINMIREEFSIQLNLREIKWLEPESLPEIMADRISILRVLRNLVDNALKYGGDSLSEIEIGYKESNESHILFVRDDGVGLKQEGFKDIFELFKREKTSIGTKGTGLGLAIVKEIAEQHQGEVWAKHGPKKGITFYISISKSLSISRNHQLTDKASLVQDAP